ncbi:MAG: Ig-like domain-containing protein [Spirochaetota bacterium]|nr:Ig-like domain-containing protein [Spirochaetota bacterium]
MIKYHKIPLFYFVIFIMIGCVIKCSDDNGSFQFIPPLDTIPPTVSISPESGTTIGCNQKIIITLNESADINKLELDGDLASESDGGTWSSATYENDTLTISPNSAWSEGIGRTLIIRCSDLAANPLNETLNLTYNVDAGSPTVIDVMPADLLIGTTQTIEINFSESMSNSSLSISGDMSADDYLVSWSNRSSTNDRLTITPDPEWTQGLGKTLIIDCDDLVGFPLTQFNLTYDIDAGVPSATETPATGSIVDVSEVIIITFSESMDTKSLLISGDISSDDYLITWSNGIFDNDRLIITPNVKWTEGIGRTLIIDCDDLVGYSLPHLNLTYDVDAGAPTATESPLSGSIIDILQPVVITFSESMNTDSLSIGGTIVSESDGGVWSSVVHINDTLTISPDTEWAEALGRTLMISCDDLVGRPVATLNLTYNVDAGAPTATSSPPSGSIIDVSDVIEVTFSESMDIGSLSIGGTMASECNSVWTNNDKILTINPSTVWTEGIGRTLTVSCDDLVGYPVAALNLIYNVDAGAPTAIASPDSGSIINLSDAIIITFSESMDVDSLSIGGTMAPEGVGIWTDIDQTLTISPTTEWSKGLGRTLTIDCEDLVGNGVATINLTYDVDGGNPTATVSPVSGSLIIDTSQAIVISFSESMDSDSLTIGGTMTSECDSGVWSTEIYMNDTLTINPTTEWSEGIGKTLTIDCEDLVGYPVGTLNLIYDVNSLSISGTVSIEGTGLEGVEITLTGPVTMETITNSSGEYSFRDIMNGTYQVIPSKTGYDFLPVEIIVIVDNDDVSAQDFLADIIKWQLTYGGTYGDVANSIQQTSDGGYIVAGYSESYGAGGKDFWVLKLDPYGIVEWDYTYGGASDDVAESIQQTSDGGYIVAGYTESYGAGGQDSWVIKLNENGIIEWSPTFGDTGNDYAKSVQQTSDGGFVVSGSKYDVSATYYDMWVIKLNSDGSQNWEETYGGNTSDYANSIQQTSDEGYIVAGYTFSFMASGGGGAEFYIIKLNDIGIQQWSQVYGGNANDFAESIAQTSPDNGYIVAGRTNSFTAVNFDVWIIKLDGDGIDEWTGIYGDSNYDKAYSIQQTSDGGYITVGETNSTLSGEFEYLMLKLNDDGSQNWQTTYSIPECSAFGRSVQQTIEGGYIVCGSVDQSSSTTIQDILILKVDNNGNL